MADRHWNHCGRQLQHNIGIHTARCQCINIDIHNAQCQCIQLFIMLKPDSYSAVTLHIIPTLITGTEIDKKYKREEKIALQRLSL